MIRSRVTWNHSCTNPTCNYCGCCEKCGDCRKIKCDCMLCLDCAKSSKICHCCVRCGKNKNCICKNKNYVICHI